MAPPQRQRPPPIGAAGWYAATALAARGALALLGAGGPLLWRPEVSTPLNSLLGVREGLRLLRLGLSPYAGAAVHAPPLVLALHAATAAAPLLYALPTIAADAAAALAIWRLAGLLCRGRSAAEAGMLLSPAALAAAYLWNPLTIASCVAGATTPLENAAVAVALLGGAARNAPLAAAGVAAGAYVGLHPLLLALPICLMMGRGPEDVTCAAEAEAVAAAGPGSSSGGGRGGPAGRRAAPRPIGAGAAAPPFDRARCGAFCAFLVAWCAALLVLSDAYLRAHPQAQCLPRVARWLRGGGGGSSSSSSGGGGGSGGACWLRATHGFALAVEDYTPNVGLFWYFLTELFDAFRPFFKFVLHSHALILAAPLALRFPRRPLFVAWALLLVSAAVRPYPSAADAAPWLALAPAALAPQLRRLRAALFLANAFVLLTVLGPAMWHQWIVVDAANPNFFYSITLLLGVFHVVVLVAGVLLTVRVEREEAGKPLEPAGGGGSGGGGGGGKGGGREAE
ncbi:phosphatidylinositol glycan anchor biosynthesis class U [Raphidocelis subcapitata]|uniref:Phosphatidylinositol glycan anchor biosynthesis class U n=1 Tax=Raphidocelis subcapitata TaxID=307507 RepID=A0A2V0NVC2_9CHLO|nr:phosphatidylinositol glycan anchor biosynthesis class U [Raphidocelis subcapitata]|eukprot:GBF91289.1 phosphatidylinositol glycan anchor biosynthesis class U [Raphidocelis subcapitata]